MTVSTHPLPKTMSSLPMNVRNILFTPKPVVKVLSVDPDSNTNVVRMFILTAVAATKTYQSLDCMGSKTIFCPSFLYFVILGLLVVFSLLVALLVLQLSNSV